MAELTSQTLVSALSAVAETMELNRDALCKLDGVIGDADHGVAMASGFSAVRASVEELGEEATPTDVLNTAARSFLNAVGASSGPLYATAFMRAAVSVKGKQVLEDTDASALIVAMADGIAHRGKAKAGDKTMLDAWIPAAEAATSCQEQKAADIFKAAAKAAQHGAESTRDIEAKLGRAARLGERSKGHVDPGAASAALFLEAVANSLNE